MQEPFRLNGKALFFKTLKLQFMKRIIFWLFLVLPALSGCSDKPDPEPTGEGKIIVLMYHRITEGEATNLYERSAANLENDLKYLKENNIQVISFDDLEKIAAGGKMPAGNCAIITFDDGDSSWYTIVRPLLLKYRMKATFFLWAYIIGKDSFLTWEEVQDMAHYSLPGGERPFTFGSHSYSHTYLLQRKSGFATGEEYNSFLDYEMRVSKELIEENVPGIVDVFSLPYGDGAGNTEIIQAAQRNGYRFIRTSVWGAIEPSEIDLYVIPSLPVLDSTEAELIGEYLGI